MIKRMLRKSVTTAVLAVIVGLVVTTGCSSKEPPVETAAEASTESSGNDVAATAEEEPISKEDLKAFSENAEPYDGEIQVVLHTSSGEETVLYSPENNKEAMAALAAIAGKKQSWIKVKSARATSTLKISGYNYSVWNMLDWDPKTCWAEGEPRSEGLWEGFSYYFSGKTRIDGFRIYPGYQKSKKVYRNNIYPAALEISVGGYNIECGLDNWIQNINRDGDSYWIDITFSKPIYDKQLSATIIAVGTYGNDPDSDCCISEFHPFHY